MIECDQTSLDRSYRTLDGQGCRRRDNGPVFRGYDDSMRSSDSAREYFCQDRLVQSVFWKSEGLRLLSIMEGTDTVFNWNEGGGTDRGDVPRCILCYGCANGMEDIIHGETVMVKAIARADARWSFESMTRLRVLSLQSNTSRSERILPWMTECNPLLLALTLLPSAVVSYWVIR